MLISFLAIAYSFEMGQVERPDHTWADSDGSAGLE